MTVGHFIVGFVICLIVLIATFAIAVTVDWASETRFDIHKAIWISWFFSSVCLGICLTVILVYNGII